MLFKMAADFHPNTVTFSSELDLALLSFLIFFKKILGDIGRDLEMCAYKLMNMTQSHFVY